MLNSILNFPVEANFIRSLVENESDLKLMLPSADLPFDESQWLSKMNTSNGNLSFKVMMKDEAVGHFAFLKINRISDEAILGLVYLLPKLRGTGISKQLLALAEWQAVQLLNLKSMLLNVRIFNHPAHKLYLNAGYVEYERTGDLIRMRKELQ